MGLLVICAADESVPKTVVELKGWPGRQRFEGCGPTSKLSNKLSPADWPQGAARRLTRQVHRRHVLTR
jgi:hypothetical protein